MSKIDEIRQAAEQGIYIGILDDIEYLLRMLMLLKILLIIFNHMETSNELVVVLSN